MDIPYFTQTYLIYFIVVILTNYSFSIFSQKTKSIGKILVAVFLSVWLTITILTVVLDIIYLNKYSLNFILFSGKLASTLPIVIIFGGIAFFIKYRKFKKVI
jgi:hypothetical protein